MRLWATWARLCASLAVSRLLALVLSQSRSPEVLMILVNHEFTTRVTLQARPPAMAETIDKSCMERHIVVSAHCMNMREV